MEEDDPYGPKTKGLVILIGTIAVYSAMLEHIMDVMVHCIYTRVEGAKVGYKTQPYRAKQRHEFLVKVFQDLPALSDYKQEGVRWLEELEKAANFRHDIIHGALNPLDMEKGEFEFSRKIRGPDGQPQKATLTISAEDLFLRGREMNRLLNLVYDFSHRLIEKFDPEHAVERVPGGS